MKTAYELAMERLSKSAPSTKLTAEKKDQLAELDNRYAAKIAEREIFLKAEIANTEAKGEYEEVEKLQKQLASERRKFQAELEEKKELERGKS